MTSIPAGATGGSYNPLIAVIIPSYNTARYIQQTLESVFSQTYKNYEPVVINDGSPDTPQLEKVLDPYMDRIRYVVRKNGGLAAARNTGIQNSSGELIALLDSDDIWEPDCLQTHLECMRAQAVDLVYGDSVFMGGSQSGERFMELFPSSGPVTMESFLSRKCNINISVLATRQCLTSAGLFDERLRRCEDFDLWGRVLNTGGRIGYHNKVVMRYRRHSESLSADAIGMALTVISVYEKFRTDLRLSSAERAVIDQQIERYRAEVSFHEGKAAFIRADFRTAEEKIRDVGRVLGSTRMRMIAHLLRLCPRMLHRLYMSRSHAVRN